MYLLNLYSFNLVFPPQLFLVFLPANYTLGSKIEANQFSFELYLTDIFHLGYIILLN